MQDFIIKQDGSRMNCQPKNGTDYSLEELQAIVGGCIEVVHANKNMIMVVDEEGAFKHSINLDATRWTVSNCPFTSRIYGNALVCHTNRVR